MKRLFSRRGRRSSAEALLDDSLPVPPPLSLPPPAVDVTTTEHTARISTPRLPRSPAGTAPSAPPVRQALVYGSYIYPVPEPGSDWPAANPAATGGSPGWTNLSPRAADWPTAHQAPAPSSPSAPAQPDWFNLPPYADPSAPAANTTASRRGSGVSDWSSSRRYSAPAVDWSSFSYAPVAPATGFPVAPSAGPYVSGSYVAPGAVHWGMDVMENESRRGSRVERFRRAVTRWCAKMKVQWKSLSKGEKVAVVIGILVLLLAL